MTDGPPEMVSRTMPFEEVPTRMFHPVGDPLRTTA